MLKSTYQKILLYKIREIIINEFNNPYYQNAANVLEVVDLGTESIADETTKLKYTDHVRNFIVYRNGSIIFNDFIRTLSCFYEIDRNTPKKVSSNSKVKKKLKKVSSNSKRKKK